MRLTEIKAIELNRKEIISREKELDKKLILCINEITKTMNFLYISKELNTETSLKIYNEYTRFYLI